MGFKDLINRAKAVQRKVVKAKAKFDTKAEKRRAKSLEKQAKNEVVEVKRLDSRLKELKREEGRLKQREAIQKKQHEINQLEARVTTKGRVLSKLDVESTKLVKAASKALVKAAKKQLKVKKKRKK